MTSSPSTDGQYRELRDQLLGKVLEPGDEEYDGARTIWNAMIDKYPAVIVKCSGATDVSTAVNYARDNDLLLAVKGGGHHVAGTAVCDDGLVIDLSAMNSVRVDPDEKTVRVQAGATWGEVDHETQGFGLATVGGQDPNIGIAGMTLGGGVGWLSRKYGLTIDNLIEVDLVTADGCLVTASESKNSGLFWALRGGGGNFGVATSFKYQLHEVGPDILAGSLIYPAEQAADVAQFYNEFMTEAPNEVRTLFGIMVLGTASYLPEELHNERATIVVSFYAGDPEDGFEVLEPLRECGEPIVDSIRKRPYKKFQRAGTSAEKWRTYLRSQYLEHLSQDAIATIIDIMDDVPSSESTVFISHRGGAEAEPAVDATAYPNRNQAYHALIEARWEDPARDEEHIEWVRQFQNSLHPFTTGEVAMNFLTDDESEDRVRASYGPNYDRLIEVKREWDSENLFRMNQNIEPTS